MDSSLHFDPENPRSAEFYLNEIRLLVSRAGLTATMEEHFMMAELIDDASRAVPNDRKNLLDFLNEVIQDELNAQLAKYRDALLAVAAVDEGSDQLKAEGDANDVAWKALLEDTKKMEKEAQVQIAAAEQVLAECQKAIENLSI